ncbi:MAG: metal ABC transporter permease [Arcanobacterium sp.]|nr:metal ABC transporter permease [Arcanobacterium sp.]MDY5589047.1 metal ABC transporter permease [Arcanobacterium sp.]
MIISSTADIVEALRSLCAPLVGLRTLAAAPYLFRPFILVVCLGIVCALVGTLVNLRASEFHAEALVHAVFPGIVAGAVFGGIDWIIPAAGAVAVVAAALLTVVDHLARKDASEAGTAVILTSFFAIGIVLSLRKGDMSGQLEALMFGRLLEVTDSRLAWALVLCAAACVVVALSWRAQVACAFDPIGARTGGINTFAMDLVLNMAVAAVVVSAATAVGTLLVIGYIVIPGAAGRLWARTPREMVVIALAVGVGAGYCGMRLVALPTHHSLSPQATVALTMTAIFLMLAVARRIVDRRCSRRAENGLARSELKIAQPEVGARVQ